MTRSIYAACRTAVAAFAAALLFAACADQPPKPVSTSETFETVATVESIDYTNRVVGLRSASGEPIVVLAGPEVRNLAQVKVGDRVVTRYTVALAAEVKKAAPGVGLQVEPVTGSRAMPGARPAAQASQTVRATVEVVAIDTIANWVEVKGPSGYYRRINVKQPKGQEFIRGLKKGDLVEITYTEGLAISVEPAK